MIWYPCKILSRHNQRHLLHLESVDIVCSKEVFDCLNLIAKLLIKIKVSLTKCEQHLVKRDYRKRKSI